MRTLKNLSILCAFFYMVLAAPANAYIVTLPYPSFVNGQIIDANQQNANNGALVNAVNGGIEAVNIGPNGLYASNLKPTSAGQATFGSGYPYTFPSGLIVGSTAASAITMQVQQAASQTADTLELQNSSGTVLDKFDSAGNLTISTLAASACLGTNLTSQLVANSGCVSSLTASAPITASAASGPITLSCPKCARTDTSNIFQGTTQSFLNVGVNGVQVVPAADNTAAILIAFNAAATKAMFRVDDIDSNDSAVFSQVNGNLGILPPAVTPSGGQIGPTAHMIWGELSTSVNATCAVNTNCSLASSTVTFSNGGVFSNASSYRCPAIINYSGSAFGLQVRDTEVSATQLAFKVDNLSTSSIGSGTTVVIDWYCVGV